MAKRLTDTEKWNDKKLSIYNKYGGKCAYCGCEISLDNFNIDHVISKCEYESDRHRFPSPFKIEGFDNLTPACCSCNNFKRAHTLSVFRSEIEQQIRRLRRYHPTFRLAERYGLLSCIDKKIVFYFEKLQENG